MKENVIEDVHILGPNSQNSFQGKKISYTPTAMQEATNLYEGLDVYIDHAEQDEDGNNKERKVRDKIGTISGVNYKEGTGIWAKEFVLNPKHPQFEQIKWWNENYPNKIGFSHDARMAINPATGEVNKILKPNSADLVAQPATVMGLHESIKLIKEGAIADKMEEDADNIFLDKLISTANSLAVNILWSAYKDKSAAAKNLIVIYKDLLSELKSYMDEESNETESVNMDLSKLTIDELKKDRPDLVTVLSKESVAPVEASKATEIDAAVKKAVTLEKRVMEAINQLPETYRSKSFETQLREAKNDEIFKELLDDRLALVNKPVSERVLVLAHESKNTEKVTNEDDTRKALGLPNKKGE